MTVKKILKPKKLLSHAFKHFTEVFGNVHIDDHNSITEFGSTNLTSLPSKPLRVGIWNLCKGAWGAHFSHDFEVLLEKCDLLLTQEALLNASVKKIFRFPGFYAVHAACYKRRDGIHDGVMTVSRSKDLGDRRRILCHKPEPIIKTQKATLINFYKLEDAKKSLMVINMHARLIKNRQGAIDEIKYLAQLLPEHSGPIIFGGDFNTYRQSYLDAIVGELKTMGLEHIEVKEDPRRRVDALDQMFVRGLDIKLAKVDTSISYSDHFPIITELTVQ